LTQPSLGRRDRRVLVISVTAESAGETRQLNRRTTVIWLVAAQSPALAIIQAKGSHEHAVVSFFEFAYKWGCNTRTLHVTGQNSWQPHLERGLSWDRGRLARSFFREAKLKTRAGRPRSQDPTSPAMTPSGAASRFAPVAVALIFQISPDQEFPRWNEFPGYHRVVAANRMNRNIRYVSQGDAIRFRLEISLGPVDRMRWLQAAV